MVRLAIVGTFVTLAATVAQANYFSVHNCLCTTKRQIFNIRQFEYRSDSLNKTWNFKDTCHNKIHRTAGWRYSLYRRKDCFYKKERICTAVDAEGAQVCVENGFPALNGTTHFYELDMEHIYEGVQKAHPQWEDQWDCTDECRAELVPFYGNDRNVKSFCNETDDGELRPAAWELHCGTRFIADLRDL